MNHDAHVQAFVREDMRRCLIRQLLCWRLRRGNDWLRGYIEGWKRWHELRAEFWTQAKAGNAGDPGDWR